MQILVIATVALLGFASAHAAQSPLDQVIDAEKAPMPGLAGAGHGDPALIELRVEAIQQEIAYLKGKHDWAGEYYFGDGLGANLSLHLAPQTGFAVTWHGCMGLYGANEGQLKVDPNTSITLDFRWKNLTGRFASFPRRLLPVRWGDRHYLVDADRIAEFINSIHSGSEPRDGLHGRHFLRNGDEKLGVEGLPSLPASWLAQLRPTELEYVVTEVRLEPKSEKDREVRATVELAATPETVAMLTSAVELESDIELLPPGSKYSESRVNVVSSSAGRITASWSPSWGDEDLATIPTVGMRFSTGAYLPSPSGKAKTSSLAP